MERFLDIIAPRSFWDLLAKAFILVAVFTLFDSVVGTFSAPLTAQHPYWDRLITFLIGAPFGVFVMWVMAAQRRLKQRLQFLSQTDVLTGLSNRANFLQCAQTALSRRGSASVLMLDVDHFKTINDTYGHYVGDVTLQQLGAHIRAQTRPQDVLGRIGGEEFAVVLPDTDAVTARKVAQRLCQDIAVTVPNDAGLPNKTLTITLSVGGVVALPNYGLIDALCEADKALYAAKSMGRNRVVFRAVAECRDAPDGGKVHQLYLGETRSVKTNP